MKTFEETMILSSHNLQFLDYMDEQYEKNQKCAKEVVDSFYSKRGYPYNKYFARLETTLGFLTSIIFFINQELYDNKDNPFIIRVKYEENNVNINNFTADQIFRSLRNTIAHIFEKGNDIHVNEEKNIVFFHTYNGRTFKITFTTEAFHEFVMECIKRSRELMKKKYNM